MRRGAVRATLGGGLAIAATSGLLCVCVAGGVMYRSSVVSEAVQRQLSATCSATAGLQVQADDPGAVAALDRLAAGTAHAEPAGVTKVADGRYRNLDGDDGAVRSLVLLWRRGMEDHVPGGELPPTGGALLSGRALERMGAAVGDTLQVTFEPPDVVRGADGVLRLAPAEWTPVSMTLEVVGEYDEPPIRPEPPFWCGVATLYRPDFKGDPPPPVAIVDERAFAGVPVWAKSVTWDLRAESEGLRRDQAGALDDRFADITAQADQRLTGAASTMLPTLLERADRTSSFVARMIAPVVWAGVSLSAVMLVAAGVLQARQDRRELRLRVVRGVRPVALLGRAWIGALPWAVAGATAGFVGVYAAVRTWGPTPEIEPDAIRRSAGLAVLSVVGAAAVIAVASTISALDFVDARPARRRSTVLPWELPVVAIAVLSYMRLSRVGGVQLAGTRLVGGDALAQAFALLAMSAMVALLFRPLRWTVRRMSRRGSSLSPSVLLGWRRITAGPALATGLLLGAAFGVGCYVQASTLYLTARAAATDKAELSLGADLVATTTTLGPLPPELADRATLVTRQTGSDAGQVVRMLGVDPSTFERAVSSQLVDGSLDLPRLLELLEGAASPGEPLPALVVGPEIDGANVATATNQPFPIREVAHVDYFPGYQAGTTMVVVDRTAMVDRITTAEEVWVREPPTDALDQLDDAGFAPRSERDVDSVFEVTSFLALKWSYHVLTVFAVLVGAVVVIAQLLVLEGRRHSRRTTHVMASRMGLDRRREAISIVVEIAIPLVAGAIVGVIAGLLASRLAVERLDSLRSLLPPARLVFDTGAIAVIGAVLVVAVASLVLLEVVVLRRTRDMEVIRGTE